MSESVNMALPQGDSRAPESPPFENMVWVPGGTFIMGSDSHYPEEAPAHEAAVNGFWMDQYPVTNEQFGRFVEATGHVTLAERPANAGGLPGGEAGIAGPRFGGISQAEAARRSDELLQLVDLCSGRKLASSGGTGQFVEGAGEESGGSCRLRRR